MYECNGCGGFVTRDFVRVFGDNRDQVAHCPACVSMSDIIRGQSVTTETAPGW